MGFTMDNIQFYVSSKPCRRQSKTPVLARVLSRYPKFARAAFWPEGSGTLLLEIELRKRMDMGHLLAFRAG